MLTRIIGRQIGKRLAKKAIRTAAQKRALRKAVLASAKARAKKVGGMALAGPKAYARSVVKRSASRKSKALNKIAKSKSTFDKETTFLKENLNKLNRQSDILKKNQLILKKGLADNTAKLDKISKYDAATDQIIPIKNNMFSRRKVRKLLELDRIGVEGYNKNVKDQALVSVASTKIKGIIAEQQNASDKLAQKYAKVWGQNLRFKAGTVARDLTGVSVIGGAGYGAYKDKNQSSNKKTLRKKA